MINNITKVCIDCNHPHLGLKALEYSDRLFPTKNNLFLSNAELKLKSWDDYNYFCLRELVGYIDTEFMLKIEWDGFVINPEVWTDDFQQYDYIGAPWGSEYNFAVGNGGFCLRSKKLMELVRDCPANPRGAEDLYICVKNKKWLEDNGCKFAPYDVALRFSQENIFTPMKTFGFHGMNLYPSYRGLLQ